MDKRQFIDEKRNIENARIRNVDRARAEEKKKKKEIHRLIKQLGLSDKEVKDLIRRVGGSNILSTLQVFARNKFLFPVFVHEFSHLDKAA